MHLHMEFAETRGLLRNKRWKYAVLLFFYGASLHLAIRLFPIHITAGTFDFMLPAKSLGEDFSAPVCLQFVVVCDLGVPVLP